MLKFILFFLIINLSPLFSEEIINLNDTIEKYSLGLNLDILEDTEKKISIEDINNPETTKLFRKNEETAPNLGISNSRFWIRFNIQNSSKMEKWFLEVPNPHIHIINLYIPKKGGEFEIIKGGNILPFFERKIETEGFSYELFIKNEPSTYYLEIENSHDALVVPLNISSGNKFYNNIIITYSAYGLYYGVMIAMLLYNFFIYITIRDKTYLYYSFYIIFFMIHVLKDNGLAYRFLWPESPEWNRISFAFTIPMANLGANNFVQYFLETDKNSRGLYITLQLSKSIIILSSVLGYFLLDLSTNIEIATIEAGLNTLFLFIIGIIAFIKNINSSGLFLIAWSPLLIGGLSTILMNFDILPYNLFTAYAIQIGTALESILLSISLANRIRIIKNEKEDAQNKLIESNKLALLNLEKANIQKDEFLTNTSHEFKTPLNAIIGLSESLIGGVAGPINPSMSENLNYILNSGRRLNNLINDILDISKLKNSELQLNFKSLNLRNIVQHSLLPFNQIIANKSIKIINNISPEAPYVFADEGRLLQILYNIIGNSLKFTESGEILIYAMYDTKIIHYQGDSKITISISDTGIGIPEEKLKDIFLPFEQVDTGVQRKYGGTGLGLSITKKLIELHGGKIWVSSSPLEGSTFYFTLPISKIQNITIETNDVIRSSSNIENRSHKIKDINEEINGTNKFTILIVDDEPMNIQILKNHLGDKNYNLLIALDGTKALSIINTQKVDLVLLDLMMPDISGLEITNLIRKKYLISSLPIIIITAKNQIMDIQNAFELGVNDYLQKPFFKEELIARIKNHLDLKKFNENLEIKVSQRTFELVTARKKIESLNNFVRILNEQKDMKELFLKISEYMYITYKVETSCLFFPNKEKTSIEVFRYYTFNKVNPDQINFAEKTKINLSEENELIINSYKSQRHLFITNKFKTKILKQNNNMYDLDLNTIDLDVANKLGLNNILIIPLIVQKETIGIYTFMNSEKDLDIKWKEAREILNFCRHLSGTINSIRLYLEYNPSMELE
jgi:two-component system, sensor histidine kinase LadS